MKKLLEHLTSIRDYLHSQEDILRRQEEEKFNKKICICLLPVQQL